jgi:hypothetical protein
MAVRHTLAPTSRRQKFTYEWRPDVVGAVTLASRATDCDGVTQPRVEARNSIYKVGIRVKC